MNSITMQRAASQELGQTGWRYYNIIRKKAVEQEFSWSGLVISLSIAFFVVIGAAFALDSLYSNILI